MVLQWTSFTVCMSATVDPVWCNVERAASSCSQTVNCELLNVNVLLTALQIMWKPSAADTGESGENRFTAWRRPAELHKTYSVWKGTASIHHRSAAAGPRGLSSPTLKHTESRFNVSDELNVLLEINLDWKTFWSQAKAGSAVEAQWTGLKFSSQAALLILLGWRHMQRKPGLVLLKYALTAP